MQFSFVSSALLLLFCTDTNTTPTLQCLWKWWYPMLPTTRCTSRHNIGSPNTFPSKVGPSIPPSSYLFHPVHLAHPSLYSMPISPIIPATPPKSQFLLENQYHEDWWSKWLTSRVNGDDLGSEAFYHYSLCTDLFVTLFFSEGNPKSYAHLHRTYHPSQRPQIQFLLENHILPDQSIPRITIIESPP